MELCSMLCGSLDGRGVWGRMDTYMCKAESLYCSPETITILLIGYMPIENKKHFKKNEIMPFAVTLMDLEIIIQSEVSQTEKDKHHMI